MPWHIGTSDTCPSSKPHAVIKDSDGTVEACHATEAQAKVQLAALYASENKEQSYKPTSGMVSAAKRGLEMRREFKRGGTQVGVARARDIANGRELPLVTVKRMHSFFSRHEVDKKAEGFNSGEDGYPSAGRVAWELWGGDAGQSWARRIVERQEKSMSEEQEQHEKYYAGEMVEETGYGIPGPLDYSATATSFAELDAEAEAHEQIASIQKTTAAFKMLISNIMSSDDIEDKGAAVRALAAEFSDRMDEAMQKELATLKATTKKVGNQNLPASAFLVVEDAQEVSTWHLPVKDAQGKPDRGRMGAAWAALHGGYRGNKYEGPNKQEAISKLRKLYDQEGISVPGTKSLLDRVMDAVKSAFAPESGPAQSGLMLWKDTATGQYKWLARYTNNLRDRDNPPEILTAQAHRRFVEMVDNKEAPLPELWLWHVPGTRWGTAQWVAYDDSGDVGFTLAGGVVDKGKEALAEALASLSPDSIRVSHGMPVDSIKRDANDKSLITEYRTREISPLPEAWAANQYTGFSILKEGNEMGIPTEKRQALQEWGLSPEVLALVEQDTEQQAAEAKEAGLESKEIESKEPELEQSKEAPEAEAETTETETQEAPVVESPLTRQEVADVLNPLANAVGALAAQVEALSKDISALKASDEAKVAAKAADTPAASLMDLLQFRAVGADETREDGRSKLSKSGPAEKEAPTPVITGIPFVDALAMGRDTQITAG